MGTTRWSPPRLRVPEAAGHRGASWLELFYDLAYVVAVAALAGRLLADPTATGALSFLGYFALIWWLWVSHTYYADRYDTDDAVYRLLAAGQMLAVVVVAASLVPGDPSSTRAFALGYGAARVLLCAMYWRAWRNVPETRALVSGYLAGFGAAAVLWTGSAFVPDTYRPAMWAVALCVDLATPWVMRKEQARAPLDDSHLPERFGLFTILVLGEAIASSVGGLAHGGWEFLPVVTAAVSILLATALWWLYFDNARGSVVRRSQDVARSWRPTIWIYTHVPLGASLVAAGVALEHAIANAGEGGMASGSRWLLAGSVSTALVAMAVLHDASQTDPASTDRRLVRTRLSGAAAVLLLGLAGGWESIFVVLGALVVCAALLFSDMSASSDPEQRVEEGDEPVISVRDDLEEGAFVIEVDGIRAGKADYRISDGRVIFTHTEISDAFSGRGLGSRLARYALDDVVRRELLIVPRCPFIAAYIRRHPEYQEMVDPRGFGGSQA